MPDIMITVNMGFMIGALFSFVVFSIICFVVGVFAPGELKFMKDFNTALVILGSASFIVVVFGGIVGCHIRF